MARAWIALGGNVGDVERTFDAALERLDSKEGQSVVARSSVYATAPVGEEAGTTYRNAAAEIETSREPAALLAHLHEVEDELGRVRTIRWGPRTLDLDLLLYEDRVLETPTLVVPHPAARYRRFVLDPLTEIAADVVHPVEQLTIRELRARLEARPLVVSLGGGSEARRRELCEEIRRVFDERVLVVDSHGESTLHVRLEKDADSEWRRGLLDVSAEGDPVRFVVDALAAALG